MTDYFKSTYILSFVLFLLMGASALTPSDTGSLKSVEPAVIMGDIRLTRNAADSLKLINLAIRVFGWRQGESVSQESLTSALISLNDTRRFKEIRVDSTQHTRKKTIDLFLTPHTYIKKIKIQGEYPLFESDIRNAMSIYRGASYDKESFKEQKDNIKRLYVNEGFYNAAINITSYLDTVDGYWVISVVIKKGPYFRLASFEISGGDAFSASRIKWNCQSWRLSLLPGMAGRFKENELRQDIQTILTLYRKKKLFHSALFFPEAEIKYQINYDTLNREAHALIKINEGFKYVINIQGCKKLKKCRSLTKNSPMYSNGNRNNLGVVEMVEQIRDIYIRNGFAQVKVLHNDTIITSHPAEKRILFTISEGQATRVEALQITGNVFYSNKQILDWFATKPGKSPYVPEILDEDLYYLQTMYRNEGFERVALTKEVSLSPSYDTALVHVHIIEGIRRLMGDVSIISENGVPLKKLKKSLTLKQGKPFVSGLVKTQANILSAVAAEEGYPHVKIQNDLAFNADSSEVGVVYRVQPGENVQMGAYYFSGNFTTNEQYLSKIVRLSEGDPFSMRKVVEGQKRLQQRDIFKSAVIRPVGLREKGEEAHLFIDLLEKPQYYIEASGGYQSDNGVFINSRAGNRNLFGKNKHAWLDGGINRLGYQWFNDGLNFLDYRVEANVLEPELFRTGIAALFNIYHEDRQEFNKDYALQTFGASIGLNRRLCRYILTGLEFRYEWRDVDGDTNNAAGDFLDPRNALVTSPKIIFDGRDSFIQPKNGTYVSFFSDFSQGMDNDIDDFNRYILEAKYFLTPVKPITLAFRSKAAFVHSRTSGGVVSPDNAFYLGGTNSVRGYSENLMERNAEGRAVSKDRLLSFTTELRFYAGFGFEICTFYDWGQLSETFADKPFSDGRSAAGGGLRYFTPIGPIGLLYGLKLAKRSGEDPGQFHFSIGYTF
ncbi:MAG: BamA/TamA family outer membrane protein [Fibrobacteria bacterium]|nr:BamA/TamA family outer membrane protein [Fibrobacteria bacterium]